MTTPVLQQIEALQQQIVERFERIIARRAAAALSDADYAKAHVGAQETADRMLAAACGLPRLCIHKRCRRRRLCLGNWRTEQSHDVPCLRLHPGLVKKRRPAAWQRLIAGSNGGDGAR